MTLCSCFKSSAGQHEAQLWERISEKREDEWGGSNSSPEVRFRIPGAHTTACLHADIPAECMSASEGPRMCVCVYTCTWWSVCFSCKLMCQNEHITFHYTSSNVHSETYQSKQSSELFSLMCDAGGKTHTDVERSWLTKSNQALITPRTPFTINSQGGWESKRAEKKKPGSF